MAVDPIGTRRLFADPALVALDGSYWIYPTTDGVEGWGSKTFHVLHSADLERWTDLGPVLTLGSDVRWAQGHAWAPAAVRRDDTVYLYYTAAEDNIGVATSTAPDGPFTDLGAPLIATGRFPGRTIDPSVFVDADGAHYLLWGNRVAHTARLNADMVSIDVGSVVAWEHPGFREAAHLHRRGDRYYLTWSENDARDPAYRVCWASGPSPFGPWRVRGVLLEQDPARGIAATGHHSILRLPGSDEWRIAYHRFAIPDGDGFHRELVIDRLEHDDRGDLVQVRPSASPLIVTAPPASPPPPSTDPESTSDAA